VADWGIGMSADCMEILPFFTFLYDLVVYLSLDLCFLKVVSSYCDWLQFTSFGKDLPPEHAREDSGLEMDSPESRYASLSLVYIWNDSANVCC